MEEHQEARQIVETLTKAGYIAYYAGGWVRDFILQHPSDDIDIATSAPPEAIQSLFPKTVPIGISFGILLVIIDGREYEVATFRKDLEYQDGRRPSQIEFTSAFEDAKRRDFTINGMFFDPLSSKVIDYVDGIRDLRAKVIRAIGDPHERIREDRLRMIRAVRLSCRFHFHIDPATEQAIRSHASELFPAVAIERVVQEFEKGMIFHKLKPMLIQLHDFGLLASIFPELKSVPLSDLERRLDPVDRYPKEAPLIAYLLQLFPEGCDPEDLARKLKLSARELQFGSFLMHASRFVSQQNNELFDWAHFYAHPQSALAIQILEAHLPSANRGAFHTEHENRRTQLHNYIQRIEQKKPLISSSDLLTIGIAPSKEMGRLLKQAERISINGQIEDKGLVLKLLEKENPR